jgi:hypothetical protein
MEVWEPEESAITTPQTQPENPQTENQKEDVVTWRRDAKRMIRATKTIAYDLLRSTQDQPRAEKPKPEKKTIKVYVTIMDRVGLPFLKHWDGARRELHVDIAKGAWEIRKYLIRTYKLKGLQWILYRRDTGEGRWAELPKLLKIAEEGDDFQLEITGRKKRQPNAPGSSRRRHFDRANSRKTKRDFVWSPPDPRRDVQTGVRLAEAGHIGYKELSSVSSEEVERKRAEVLESLLRQKEELLVHDNRVKMTVETQGGAPEGYEARRHIDAQKEHSDTPPPPLSPAATQRAIEEVKKEVQALEIIAAERAVLEERDEEKRRKNEAFMKAFSRRPPPPKPMPPSQIRFQPEEEESEPEQEERMDPAKALAVSKAQATARVIAELKFEREQKKKEEQSRKPKPKDEKGKRAIHSKKGKKRK